jgi:hypothetical protein
MGCEKPVSVYRPASETGGYADGSRRRLVLPAQAERVWIDAEGLVSNHCLRVGNGVQRVEKDNS